MSDAVPAEDSVPVEVRWMRDLLSEDSKIREAAAEAIVLRYTNDLLALAQNQLCSAVRAKVRKSDVVQEAFLSFFNRHHQGEKPFLIEQGGDLKKLLVAITLNKAKNVANFFMRAKRDIRKEQPQEIVKEDNEVVSGMPRWVLVQIAKSIPDHAELAILEEQKKELLAALPDDKYRKIAELKLAGYTNEELAEELGCSVRTVESKVSTIKACWKPFLKPRK